MSKLHFNAVVVLKYNMFSNDQKAVSILKSMVKLTGMFIKVLIAHINFLLFSSYGRRRQ